MANSEIHHANRSSAKAGPLSYAPSDVHSRRDRVARPWRLVLAFWVGATSATYFVLAEAGFKDQDWMLLRVLGDVLPTVDAWATAQLVGWAAAAAFSAALHLKVYAPQRPRWALMPFPALLAGAALPLLVRFTGMMLELGSVRLARQELGTCVILVGATLIYSFLAGWTVGNVSR